MTSNNDPEGDDPLKVGEEVPEELQEEPLHPDQRTDKPRRFVTVRLPPRKGGPQPSRIDALVRHVRSFDRQPEDEPAYIAGVGPIDPTILEDQSPRRKVLSTPSSVHPKGYTTRFAQIDPDPEEVLALPSREDPSDAEMKLGTSGLIELTNQGGYLLPEDVPDPDSMEPPKRGLEEITYSKGTQPTLGQTQIQLDPWSEDRGGFVEEGPDSREDIEEPTDYSIEQPTVGVIGVDGGVVERDPEYVDIVTRDNGEGLYSSGSKVIPENLPPKDDPDEREPNTNERVNGLFKGMDPLDGNIEQHMDEQESLDNKTRRRGCLVGALLAIGVFTGAVLWQECNYQKSDSPGFVRTQTLQEGSNDKGTILPIPKVSSGKVEKQTSAEDTIGDKSPTNQLIWLDQTEDGSTFLRANISDPRFQTAGIGVGNLISAIWENPKLSQLNSDEAAELIVTSNMKGASYSDPRFLQLEECIAQQETRREIGNPNVGALRDPSMFGSTNILFYNPTLGESSHFSCELSGSFTGSLEARTSDAKEPTGRTTPTHFEEQRVRKARADFDSDCFESDLNQGQNSEYQGLQKLLRNEEGNLAQYDSIGIDTIAATYKLINAVNSGEVKLTESEKKELAIDAYNALSDQSSGYFISVADIKKSLGVNCDLRSEAIARYGIGRREQIIERRNQLENEVADSYQAHLATTDGNPERFEIWTETLKYRGVSDRMITRTLAEVPNPSYLEKLTQT